MLADLPGGQSGKLYWEPWKSAYPEILIPGIRAGIFITEPFTFAKGEGGKSPNNIPAKIRKETNDTSENAYPGYPCALHVSSYLILLTNQEGGILYYLQVTDETKTPVG